MKPSAAPVGSPGQYVFSAGRVSLANDTLAFLIAAAWDVREENVFGLPAWAKALTFVIDARAEAKATRKEMQPMLQNLIAERFALKFHRETRRMDVYILGRSGNTNAHPAARQACAEEGASPIVKLVPCGRVGLSLSSSGEARARGSRVTSAVLASSLGNFWHRTVIDQSGLEGTFDVELDFSVDMDQPGSPNLQAGPSNGAAPPAPPGPPRFTYIPPGLNRSLNEQLGLKLQQAKGPVEVIVIDHVERPSAN